MPAVTPPPFVQGGSHTSKQVRQFVSAMQGQAVQTFVNSVGAVGPAHGLVAIGDLAVVQNGTPNMSVNIGIGRAFISGNSSLVQGAYIFTNDATTNVVIAAADASNSRRDLVCAQVRETIEDSSGFNDARLFVVTGTPAATPVDPAIPAGCLVLARVTVAALSTSVTNANITTVALKHASKLTEQTDRLACHLTRSVNQSIPNNTSTAVLFDVETFDAGGLHSTSVDTDRITCPTGGGGLWLLCYAVTYDTNSSAFRSAFMSKNGSAGDRHGIEIGQAVASNGTGLSGTTIQRMVPGDYFRLITSQNSGAALNILGDAIALALTSFAATRLGD